MTPSVLVLNSIADYVIFSFTINISCLVILFNSDFEMEVKCFKKHLWNSTSLEPYTQAVLNKLTGQKSSNKSIFKVLSLI